MTARLGILDFRVTTSGDEVKGEHELTRYDYSCLCLPDTVDPRGPKGK